MLLRLRLPKTLLWVFNLLVIFVLLFTAYRLITLVAFMPRGERWSDFLPTFFLGLRYDLRWISIILFPIVIASLIPELSPFYSQRNRKIWTWYLAVVTFFIIFFFAADFGAFSYNYTRLDASSLNFIEDFEISSKMLWQTYPIVWMLIGLFITVILLRMIFRKTHVNVVIKTDGKGIPYRRKWILAAIGFLAFLAYGNVGPEPLKRSAAFRFNNSFKSFLALNPLQNFFYTLKLRRTVYDETKARAYFPLMKKWLDLENQNEFSYKRVVQPYPDAIKTKPNIVLVICESFSMYKSSLSGNPLNTTPFFKSMADSGILFNRCFTPHFSTARGLFATLTGIPDVQLSKFSTRNPQALDQHTIINEFEGYQKFYFLGGSPSFNNFEGLVKNIKGVQMNVEGDFECEPVDVWGISDKDLFMEANKVFTRQTQPFFAIIQTADNHRPFTIPEEDAPMFKKDLPKSELKKYGFESVQEYNAFRYADYCIRKFIETARQQSYFDNTIFVFIGDHGVSGDARNIYPKVYTDQRLTNDHVPLLFYAPRLLKPQQRNEVVSQIDVLPTIAGLLDMPYTNTTLGRDVLHNKTGKHYAFTIVHDEGKIGMITDHYYFVKHLDFNKEEVFPMHEGISYTPRQVDSIKALMGPITSAYYETARWMLVHNKK